MPSGRLLLFCIASASLVFACEEITIEPAADSGSDAQSIDSSVPPVLREQEVDQRFFEEQMQLGRIPGLAVAVVGPDGVLWSSTHGVKDVDTDEAIREDTLFGVASVSKLVVGLLLMQAVEAAQLHLEDDAEGYLTHPLIHPLHPNEAMSIRSLATHTSGLRDTLSLFLNGFTEGDPDEELGVFTASYATEDGDLYAPENFSVEAPGTTYAYSNFGIALLGHALEGATAQDFRSLSTALLESLSMDARFFLADVDAAQLAVSYAATADSFAPILMEILYYPAGGLKGSLVDMARLLRLFMNDGELEGVRLLEPNSVARMEQVANSELNTRRGLILNSTTIEGVLMHGHNGAGAGSSADVWYGPNFGIVVLANSNAYVRSRFGDPTGTEAMRAIRSYVTRRGLELTGE
ncbi:MAG: CubicO group peptidase (beta-lactamase class C family) [Polyangiales bacterium]|jgi:CubicO group peptidase (beta-lactamase class C family)